MAPSSSSVHIRLAEPVVFLRNLDSATDRQERRAQRRHAQQAAEALLRAGDHTHHAANGAHGSNSLFGGPDQGYIPPSGRGGAGSRDRSSSQARARSASRGRPSTGTVPNDSSPALPNSAQSLAEATADLRRGRSPAPRRDPQEAAEPAAQQQQPTTPAAIPGANSTIQTAAPLPLVDVPVIQPEDTDIGLTRPPAIIRGVMTVHFSKPTRVKKIGIRLKGQSKTEWPEGLGPRRLDTAERNKLIDETVLFFDATSSAASQSRRAASVGPGTATLARDNSVTPEAFSSGTRVTLASAAGRSASMMPSTRPTGVLQQSASSSQSPRPSTSAPRAPSMDAQRTMTHSGIRQETHASTISQPAGPPEYSPLTASAGTMTSGASATITIASRSPSRASSVSHPESHAQPSSSGTSSQQQHQPPSPVDPPRPIPHEHFANRAAELRAEAATMSPPSTPLTELSPAPSRASSVYDRGVTTATAAAGGSTDNSRPPSVISSIGAQETYSTSSPHSHQIHDSPIVQTPLSIDNPLESVETNASGFSVSSSSDVEAVSSLEEQRGRSVVPIQREREREDLTTQTIREDGPPEAYLDHPNGATEAVASSSTPGTRAASASISTWQSTGTSTYQDSTSQSVSATYDTLTTPSAASLPSTSSTSTGRRSSSVASNNTISTPKSTRFSLSSLIHRDKSSSRTRRSASPESMLHSKRAHSTSRNRGNSLQVIKHALSGALHDKDAHLTATQVTHTPISSDAESESDDEHGRGRGRSGSRSTKWQEFKAGSYNFPIYFPIPLSLPPTIHANHGQVTYMLKGFVNRAGALTTNMHTVTEVHVVAAPHEDDLEAMESIIVERMWETQLNYRIVIHCKSVPIGGQIPVTIRLSPLSKMKLFRLSAVLEERFTVYAKDRKLCRTEPIRRFDLVKIQKQDNSAMLPIISDDPDAIAHSPLKDWIADATTTEGTGIQTLDPNGPWVLSSNIAVPDCTSALQFSTSHRKANIAIIHSLKIIMRVERGDDEYLDSKGDRKKFDIIVEAPMHILSCRTAAVNALPTYTTAPSPVTNPFDAHGEISIDSSAFHPHELSESERHALHYRSVGGHSLVPHRAQHNRHHTMGSMSAEVTGVSDVQLQEALLQGSGAVISGPPPPSYEYVATHPDEAYPPPLSVLV